MRKTIEKGQASDFSTMGDDLLESRFNRSSIRVFQERYPDFEALLTQRSYHIPTHFLGEFDRKSQQAIQHLINTAFAEAEKHDLKLEYTDVEVAFFTPGSWFKSKGQEIKKITALPAARISRETGTPIVELIIPERVTTSEQVIKTVRLLFSKLFGQLFFAEHVLKKHAFRSVNQEETALIFDLTEKSHFCRLMDEFPVPVLKHFDQIAQHLQVKGPKARDFGKKEFFRQLLHPAPPRPEQVLEIAFAGHLTEFKMDPSRFYQKLTDRLFALFPQSTLILPYDHPKFTFLKFNTQWTLFNALDERLQLVINTIHELKDCRDFLNAGAPDRPLDIALSDLWRNALGERIRLLKKKGLVKPFLLEDAILSPKQQLQRSQFPLWLWQNCIDKKALAGKNADRIVQRLSDQYKHSSYQKLFELCLRLLQTIKDLQKDHSGGYAQAADHRKINALFAWLEVRLPTLEDMHFGCRVGHQLSGVARPEGINRKIALQNFEAGWAYFVSFALVHQYFLRTAKTEASADARSQRFFDLIAQYVLERIARQPSFQIACLLLEVYKQWRFDLKTVTELIRQETQILDFFILHQPDIFKRQSEKPIEIIQRYAANIVHWQRHRNQQKIQKEELAS